MSKAQVSEQDKALVSALLDGEQSISDKELAQLDAETLGRYSLIGDLMRGDTAPTLDLDLADRVAAQLESEPVHADFSASRDKVSTGDKGKVISLNWFKPVSQLAIAASVALVAVVGVQTLPQSDVSEPEQVPMLQTMPFAGVASPVSYSSEPALDNAQKGLRELQQQRIGALVLEHQRQARVAGAIAKSQADEPESKEQEEAK